MRVFKNTWFVRFARRERIDNVVLLEAIDRAELGLIDGDLGGGVIKQRVARPRAGRSGGYRTLILYRRGERAVFAFGFAKSAMANVDAADVARLRAVAEVTLALSEDDIDRLVSAGKLIEVK